MQFISLETTMLHGHQMQSFDSMPSQAWNNNNQYFGLWVDWLSLRCVRGFSPVILHWKLKDPRFCLHQSILYNSRANSLPLTANYLAHDAKLIKFHAELNMHERMLHWDASKSHLHSKRKIILLAGCSMHISVYDTQQFVVAIWIHCKYQHLESLCKSNWFSWEYTAPCACTQAAHIVHILKQIRIFIIMIFIKRENAFAGETYFVVDNHNGGWRCLTHSCSDPLHLLMGCGSLFTTLNSCIHITQCEGTNAR